MLTFRDACAITDTTTDTTILTGGAFSRTMAARYDLDVGIYIVPPLLLILCTYRNPLEETLRHKLMAEEVESTEQQSFLK